ncbi:MAG: thiamine diphosphokinase [Bacteroidales bacterium]|nr:thiamine diphosphokinase [Bacteroidales bacterium]
MNIAIIAKGAFPRKEYPRYLISSADAVVCCDGALAALEKRGIVPDVVIGDLDSICQHALGRFKGIRIHDSNQENNDLSKAFDYVMSHYTDIDAIHIIGATGMSEAHTIGNLSLLMEYEKRYGLSARGINADIVSDYCTAFAIADSCDLHIGAGRRMSLFSPDPSLNVKSAGLKWPTDNVVFDNWWKATLNIASEDVVSLTLSHPAPVLIILD